jgi:hypothetical protein
MKGKIVGTIAAAVLTLGVMSASASAAPNPNPPGGGDCHANLLQLLKAAAGTNSTEATADAFEVTVQSGQEIISSICGKS